MSTTFTELLRELAAKNDAERKAGKAIVDEWRSAIENLFGQIRALLAEADPDGIIQIDEKEHEVTEKGLGKYRIPYLDLRGVGKTIFIIPKARKTVGSVHPPQKSASER